MNFNKILSKELIRFIIVGFIATVIHYVIYLSLLKFTSYNISYSVGYLTSLVLNYFLTSFFTFKSKPNLKKGFGFILSHLINFLLHILLLNFYLYIGIPEKIAPIPVFAVAVPVNFILVRFVFTSKFFRHE